MAESATEATRTFTKSQAVRRINEIVDKFVHQGRGTTKLFEVLAGLEHAVPSESGLHYARHKIVDGALTVDYSADPGNSLKAKLAEAEQRVTAAESLAVSAVERATAAENALDGLRTDDADPAIESGAVKPHLSETEEDAKNDPESAEESDSAAGAGASDEDDPEETDEG